MPEIPLHDPDRENPSEYTEVEYPMLAQLVGLGWQYLQGNLDYPQKTPRHFRESCQNLIRTAILKIISRKAMSTWMTYDRAIRELERTKPTIFWNGKEITEKLA
jgi:hypothetical protein